MGTTPRDFNSTACHRAKCGVYRSVKIKWKTREIKDRSSRRIVGVLRKRCVNTPHVHRILRQCIHLHNALSSYTANACRFQMPPVYIELRRRAVNMSYGLRYAQHSATKRRLPLPEPNKTKAQLLNPKRIIRETLRIRRWRRQTDASESSTTASVDETIIMNDWTYNSASSILECRL
jgi:hypothetical protein